MKTMIPEGYRSLLSVYDTQMAIGLLHRLFEDNLSAALNIYRVSAPLFVEESSGLNDNLNGVERPVCFEISATGTEAQVVQSLAKWKRMALHRYGFYPGKGIYTDMNAIRRDEDTDNIQLHIFLVLLSGHITAAAVENDLHVQRSTFGEGCNMQVGVENLDLAVASD